MTNVKLPALVYAEDYHEFYPIEKALKQIGLKVKVREIGFNGDDYVGLVFKGREPKYKEIQKLFPVEIKKLKNFDND